MSTQPNTTDLDRLEALAKAADQGEGQHIYTNPRDSNGWRANEAWHRAANPAAIQELIALVRRSQPVAATQQAAEPVVKVSPAELRDIQSGLMAVPVRSNNWRDDQTIPMYLAAPVAQQSEAARIDWPAIRATLANVIAVASVRITDKDADDEALLDKADKALAELDRYVRAAQPTEAGAPTAAATHAEIYTLRRLIECAEKLDARPRPMCRDCADENGTCPNSGLECDLRKLFTDAKALHNRLAAPTSGRESAAPGAKQDAPAFDPVVEANRKLLLERSHVGMKKYGTTLAAAGLSRAELAQHALEEALDLANYLQTIIQTDAAMQKGAQENG